MPTSLPPEVVAALQRGNALEAIRLLRKSNPKMGLAEARVLLDEVKKLAAGKPSQAPGTKPSHAGGLQASHPHHAVAAKHHAADFPRRPGLSPGEVPRTSGSAGGMALLVAIVMAVLLYVRYG